MKFTVEIETPDTISGSDVDRTLSDLWFIQRVSILSKQRSDDQPAAAAAVGSGDFSGETWTRYGTTVYFYDGGGVVGGFNLRDCPDPVERARRIVACFNACRMAGTGLLEEQKKPLIGTIISLGDKVTNAEKQRDQLLDVLEALNAYWTAGNFSRDPELWGRIKNAITAGRGGAQ